VIACPLWLFLDGIFHVSMRGKMNKSTNIHWLVFRMAYSTMHLSHVVQYDNPPRRWSQMLH